MVASIVEIIIGLTGLVGMMLRYIGPLAIAPGISLEALSLFDAAAEFSARNWYIALA